MRRSRVAIAVAAALALFGSVAFFSDATEAAGTSPVSVEAASALPLEHLVDDESERALFEARQLLLRDCMAGAGFEYPTVEYVSDPVLPRYGIDDGQLAASAGYDFYDVLLADWPPAPALDTSAGWEGAFFGDWESRYVVPSGNGEIVSRPGSGCIWESDLVLYGADPSAHFALTLAYQGVRGEASDRFFADPERAEVVAEWSVCMADSGYDIGELYETSTLRTEADPAAKAAAVTDAQCKDELDLVQRLIQIESAIQATVLADNADLVEDWLTSTESSVDNAKAVVAERGTS
jgi:hypothetical protein